MLQEQLQDLANRVVSINDIFSQPGGVTVDEKAKWFEKAAALKQDLAIILADTCMATSQ